MNELSCITLRKVDPSKNMARQYSVAVCQDLFGTPVVVCRWGRIGRAGRSNQRVCTSLEEAQALAEELVEKRRRRGYCATGASEASVANDQLRSTPRANTAYQVPNQRRRRTKRAAVEHQLCLLTWAVAKTARPLDHRAGPASSGAGARRLPAEGSALMRSLGKPATSAERERAMSMLTLAASLRGIPLHRGPNPRPLH
jgi:predicted DNA-binding WGR domain protein